MRTPDSILSSAAASPGRAVARPGHGRRILSPSDDSTTIGRANHHRSTAVAVFPSAFHCTPPLAATGVDGKLASQYPSRAYFERGSRGEAHSPCRLRSQSSVVMGNSEQRVGFDLRAAAISVFTFLIFICQAPSVLLRFAFLYPNPEMNASPTEDRQTPGRNRAPTTLTPAFSTHRTAHDEVRTL